MSVRKQQSAGIVLGVLTLIITSGCGRETSQQSAMPSASSASAPDESARSFYEHSWADAESGTAASGMDFTPADPDTSFETPSSRLPLQQILTAGSLDDVRNDDEFRDYVTRARQRSEHEIISNSLREWDGRRIEIMVRNSDGRPVPDAVVRIFRSRNVSENIRLKYQPGTSTAVEKESVAILRTGSDGRTHFLPGFDGTLESEDWSVEILNAQGELRVRQHGLRDPGTKSWWEFAIGKEPSRLPEQLDLALVVDTTGSMGDELEYLKCEISSIAAQVDRLFPGVDQRYALVCYRDNGDHYVSRTFDFSGSLGEFQHHLNEQHASGGGDYPEAVHAALEQANDLSWRNQNTARVMFLVGDAPPHAEHGSRTLEAVRRLRDRGVTIFPVAGSGTLDEAEFTFRLAAFVTMGQYLFLTDHSGVGLPHAVPDARQYNVEWLSAVMIRMIAGELSGRDVLPSEIIATEAPVNRLLSHAPHQYPRVNGPVRQNDSNTLLLSRADWKEIRPLVALALLFLLALVERRFASRPTRQITRHHGDAGIR